MRKKENIYQRIGLVEISEIDFLNLSQIGQEEKSVIKFNEKNLNIELVDQTEQILEPRIEVLPK